MVNQIALDSNTAIALLNGEEQVVSFVHSFHGVCLPSIVCGELLYGAQNSGSPEKNLPKYVSFIEKCETLTVNLDVAEKYASTRLALKK